MDAVTDTEDNTDNSSKKRNSLVSTIFSLGAENEQAGARRDD